MRNLSFLFLTAGFILLMIATVSCDDHDKNKLSVPVPAFEATATEIFIWEQIRFEDISEHEPEVRMWTFEGGDPESSDKASPEVLYTKPGLYSVKLAVFNEHGGDSLELKEFVSVKEYPLHQGTLTDDRDGRIYPVTLVGGQLIMAQNLSFDTGDAVFYDNDQDNAGIHGMLYTWDSAMEACPAGWRLPTRGEFDLMREYLGGEYVAGGRLKEAGTENWDEPNAYATNSTSFSAVGSGGYQPGHLDFFGLGESVTMWTQTEAGDDAAWSVALSNKNGRMVIQNNTTKKLYFSVRCIKD